MLSPDFDFVSSLHSELAGITVVGEAHADIEGAFILSINERPEIRELFGSFHMDEVTLKYTVAKSEATEAKELIVSNRKASFGLI